MVTADRVRQVLSYNRRTGVFRRRVRTSQNMRVGDVAGTLLPTGYVSIGIDGTPYLAHRLAWLHVHGRWPKGNLDHRDRNRANNVFRNLRECSQSANLANARKHLDNASGYKGVSKMPGRSTWRARITVDRKDRTLGYFTNPQAAYRCYCKAARKAWGEFAHLSR